MEAVTILLADDESMLLLDFEGTLTGAGFLVTSVTSGAKAIAILHSANSQIDGVVTDIRFREFPDGWEVARVAREIDAFMPIVYISGHGALDWVSRGVPDSIMIEKPFTQAQLVTAVSQLLNARPPRAPQPGA
ncbi:response regulator [Sinorhizobium meliloti]|uniref:response regulator n=1 Tax=Rhizobium meliloti TaxID=382 RepID=UPI003F163F3D